MSRPAQVAGMTARVVAFVNGELGRHALSLVRDKLVAVVINEGCDYRYGPLMEKPWETAWFYGNDPFLAPKLELLGPTHGVSAGYREILTTDVIEVFEKGIANVHTSLLPFGRGANPNAWAIFYDQPAGVTVHLIDGSVDTGPIIFQQHVKYDGADTAATLQEKLIAAAKPLMNAAIPAWIGVDIKATPQAKCDWPTHRKKELETICIEGDKKYHGWEIINILRARTFAPYPGALYTAPNGEKYRVRIQIEREL
jgi:methionyl-tRNA formyltransferase